MASVTIVLMAYAILLLVGGAPMWAWVFAGMLACIWQFLSTLATGMVPPPVPESALLQEEVEE
jgi:hypothetical protein